MMKRIIVIIIVVIVARVRHRDDISILYVSGKYGEIRNSYLLSVE